MNDWGVWVQDFLGRQQCQFWKSADMAVCLPSVLHLSPWTDSGPRRLAQPQMESMTTNSNSPTMLLACNMQQFAGMWVEGQTIAKNSDKFKIF